MIFAHSFRTDTTVEALRKLPSVMGWWGGVELIKCLTVPCRSPAQPLQLAAFRIAMRVWLRTSEIDSDVISTGCQPTHTAAEAAASLMLADETCIVKSLVFIAGHSPVLVLLRGCDHASFRLVERHLGCRVRMATSQEAEMYTGQQLGTIGPLSPAHRLPVFIDQRVVATAG